MGNRTGKSDLRSTELETSPVCCFEFFRYLLCGLTKHPATSSLCGVDFSTAVLGKDDFSFVDSFEGFLVAPKPDRVYEIGRVMIMMVVRYRYDSCFVCGFLDPFPRLIPCTEFPRVRHQAKSGSQRNTGIQQDSHVFGLH